jgi:transcriptional regulator with XRE-family HTH domain
MKSQAIGTRIRKIMEQQSMSIDTLVERGGLERTFITAVLDHDVYPSLGPLIKITRVLGVRLGTLIDDHDSTDPLVIRREDRKAEMSMLRAKGEPVALKFYSLGKGKTDRHMEPFFVELLPESAEDRQLSSHEGEEFIVVTSGQVEVLYGKDVHLLNPGDSIYYNSIVPHHVGCLGDKEASIYAVLYMPE